MNVIITGASKGLGKAMAEFFASHGHSLFLCARNEFTLYQALEELTVKFPGAQIKAKPFDLSKKEEAVAFGNWVLEFGVSIDVLINNAGSFIPGNIGDEPPGALEDMLDVNLFSAYHVTRTLLPTLKRQRHGHIFNICSIASLQAYPNGGAYSISKFALAGFSKNLREELKTQGIKVTGVYPGAVFTDSWSGSGVNPQRIMRESDVAQMVYTATQLSPQAVVEDLVMRPQLGDL